ncbi:hypothetical protein JD844_015268 [Phrynosoma platyrhinos]|uniref:Major facilitator superfamily (MFS) profile domain-containing protein n=1 Tax=Phrynosoma platyrhinos TaxID=52577 RepID=A0ABQ7T8U2_PHRPL|nr:hypothetical protein JD844_015268 [Phrynosoma platyrhinos]
MWGGYCVMAALLAGLTLTLSLQHLHPWVPYCSLLLIFCFVFSFGIGPAGATTSIRMEIFDQSSRGSGFVVSAVLFWVGMFAIGMVFPFIVEGFGPFCFLLFGGILCVSGFLIYFFLPETKEKSILEIQQEFDRLNFKGKKKKEAKLVAGDSFCTKL